MKLPKALFFKTEFELDKRNFGLDYIRAFYILLFVGLHTNNYINGFSNFYKAAFINGYIVQELAFGLSGFLIGNQILKYINHQNSNIKDLFNFYKRRWIRTIPFYYIFLIINIVLFIFVYSNCIEWCRNLEINFFEYFTFTQSFFNPHPYFYPEIWPLPIEEFSYLILPLMLLIIVKINKEHLTTKKIITFLVSAILIVSVFRTYYVYHNNPEADWELRKVVFYRLDAIVYGFLIYLLTQEYELFFLKHKNKIAILAFTIALLFYLSQSYINILLYKTLLFVVVPFAISFCLPFFYYSNFNYITIKVKAIITHISLISYSILLSHLFFIQFLMTSIYRPHEPLTGVFFTVVYLVVVFVFSTFFYNYVERPILLLREHHKER